MKKLIYYVATVVWCLGIWSCSRSLPTNSMNSERLIDQGYSTQKEGKRTTAISQQTISEKDHGMTMADIFARVPGVTVAGSGNNISLRVRGRKSFNFGSQPLFVLNGQVMGYGFQSVNFLTPDMIDRVSVLRDAASAADYGSRGANGVILITLKKNNG